MKKDNFKIVMIVDTREKKNEHILKRFIKNGIEVENKKLDFGDYSFKIVFDNGEEVDFSNKFTIERKKDLNELAQNLGVGRERFTNELNRMKEAGAKMEVLIEDNNWYINMTQGKYIPEEQLKKYKYKVHVSKLKPEVFKNTIMSFEGRYNVKFQGLPEKAMASYIYNKFYWIAKNYTYGVRM